MNKLFDLKGHNTTVRTEIIAGVTTFFTMAYIIFVNANILSLTGMDRGAVTVATILAAALATLIMGLVANVPFALAPGMGMNAFFTFTVCFSLGFKWQQALAMVFICGLINIVITVTKIRKMLIHAIPQSLQYAISGGIGLFIAYIGIKEAHILKFTSEPLNIAATLPDGTVIAKDVIPAMVNFTDPITQVAMIGVVIIIVLMLLRVKGAILIGIVAATLIGIPMGVTMINVFDGFKFQIPSLAPTFFALDIPGLSSWS
jgi:AGZA family xanthine/uracil permease-like MFS transporter